jgi:hypothetical protein
LTARRKKGRDGDEEGQRKKRSSPREEDTVRKRLNGKENKRRGGCGVRTRGKAKE